MTLVSESAIVRKYSDLALEESRQNLLSEAKQNGNAQCQTGAACTFLGCAVWALGIEGCAVSVREDRSGKTAVALAIPTPAGNGALTVNVTIDEALSLAAEETAFHVTNALRTRIARDIGFLADWASPPAWIVGRPGVIDDGYVEGIYYSEASAEHVAATNNAEDRESGVFEEGNELAVYAF